MINLFKCRCSHFFYENLTFFLKKKNTAIKICIKGILVLSIKVKKMFREPYSSQEYALMSCHVSYHDKNIMLIFNANN